MLPVAPFVLALIVIQASCCNRGGSKLLMIAEAVTYLLIHIHILPWSVYIKFTQHEISHGFEGAPPTGHYLVHPRKLYMAYENRREDKRVCTGNETIHWKYWICKGTYHSLTSSRPSLGAKIKAKSHGYRNDSQLLKGEREKDSDNENGATGEAKAPLSHSSSSVKTKKIKGITNSYTSKPAVRPERNCTLFQSANDSSKSNVFVAVGIRSPNEALRTIQGYSTNSAAAGGIIAGSRSKSAEHP